MSNSALKGKVIHESRSSLVWYSWRSFWVKVTSDAFLPVTSIPTATKSKSQLHNQQYRFLFHDCVFWDTQEVKDINWLKKILFNTKANTVEVYQNVILVNSTFINNSNTNTTFTFELFYYFISKLCFKN